MQILYILRTIAMYVYMFGYMLLFYGTLRRGEKAKAAGDLETVRQIVNDQIPRWCRGLLKVSGVRMTVKAPRTSPHRGRWCLWETTAATLTSHHAGGPGPSPRDPGQGRAGPHPLQTRWMNLLGCVYVKRDDIRGSLQALKDAAQVVKAGESFTIFPEGTRYKGEEGAWANSKPALSGLPSRPGCRWCRWPFRGPGPCWRAGATSSTRGTSAVTILPAIQTAGMKKDEQTQLPEAVRQNILAALTRLDQTIL